MKVISSCILATTMVFVLPACEEKKPQTVEKPTPSLSNRETERLGAAVDAYLADPTEARASDVERALAELDGEIAELDERVEKSSGGHREEAQRKAVPLRAYRDREKARFTEARLRAKTQEEVSTVGSRIEAAAEKVGDGVKDAVDTVKEKMP
jgi:hypothetical protein